MRQSVYIFCLVCVFLSASANAISYDITEIGAYSIAGINNSGQVAVQFDTRIYPGQRVGIWQNGSVQLLGMTGATTSQDFEQQEAKGINNNGHVIVRQTTYLTSYVWRDGVFTQIQPLPLSGSTTYGTEVLGINDHGHAVGQSWVGQPDGYHAFFWNGTTQDICGRDVSGQAVAINNFGQIVGQGCGQRGSFLYGNGQFFRFEDFGATDINDSGIVVGQATGFDSGGRAALWDGDALQVLSSDWGESLAINSHGAVVGAFSNGLEDNSAFMWDATNGILDLNEYIDPSLGVFLRQAVDINDLGQIIAYGRLSVGDQTSHRAYLLTPTAVPVPPAVWLFCSGLLGIVGFAKRNKAIQRH